MSAGGGSSITRRGFSAAEVGLIRSAGLHIYGEPDYKAMGVDRNIAGFNAWLRKVLSYSEVTAVDNPDELDALRCAVGEKAVGACEEDSLRVSLDARPSGE